MYPDAFARETELALTKTLKQTVIIAVPLLRRSTDYDSETPGSKRRETKLGVLIGNTRKRSTSLQGDNRQQIPASNGFSEAPVMSQVAVNDGGVVNNSPGLCFRMVNNSPGAIVERFSMLCMLFP
ncbi:hypothetical protein E3N88_29704 [Mikania micrantha]|uniref:Uncharacterized protein n=1 Tax=Mikania micrantha TaxID=192012 RepID=A0A5N6MJK0_9ASTR|nr:hypothetical protein E3N88_29704 [Mikania micrantha]